MKRTIFSALLAVIAIQMTAQTFSISGTVLDKATGKPIEFATIALTKTEQWAVADADGKFTIQNVQKGTNEISVSCLGYVPDTKEINISKDILSYKIFLKEDNLALESVVITASWNCDSFLRVIDWMPFVVELDFEGTRFLGKTEHVYVEKLFKP